MSVTNLARTIYRNGRMWGSFVYMLLCQDGGPIYVKIGFSDDPFRRIQTLRNGCPVTPQRLAFTAVPSRVEAKKVEASLHRAMSPWRTHGEWFKFECDEKDDFNLAWQKAFRESAPKGWPLKWLHLPLDQLIENWALRKKYAQYLWRKRGPTYQDFLAHCKN